MVFLLGTGIYGSASYPVHLQTQLGPWTRNSNAVSNKDLSLSLSLSIFLMFWFCFWGLFKKTIVVILLLVHGSGSQCRWGRWQIIRLLYENHGQILTRYKLRILGTWPPCVQYFHPTHTPKLDHHLASATMQAELASPALPACHWQLGILKP